MTRSWLLPLAATLLIACNSPKADREGSGSANTEPEPSVYAERIPDSSVIAGALFGGAKLRASWMLEAGSAAYAAGDGARAAKLRARHRGLGADLDFYLLHGAGLQELGEYQASRELLFEGERRLLDPKITALIELNFDADPGFVPPIKTLERDVDLDAIKYLGGGSTIVLRFLKDKTTIAAFKPRQSRLQSDYRAEVAAWRLCPLIRCGFDIPVNRHVKLTWRDFDALFSRINSAKQRAYRENFVDLKLTKEGGEDWVHGVMKDWVPEFSEYPIELSGLWRPWLLVENPIEELAAPAAEVLHTIEKRHPRGEKLSKELEKHLGEMSKRELARQISNLLVFDFLSNNWDRFSGVKAFWGVNCQFANQRFVSIDNGASFPRTPNEKVDKQLFRVQRFSRQLVHAVRLMDRERMLERLFPEATDYEKERFETFWSQRQRFLEYVDGLIAEHGEASVLVFD